MCLFVFYLVFDEWFGFWGDFVGFEIVEWSEVGARDAYVVNVREIGGFGDMCGDVGAKMCEGFGFLICC